MKTLIYGGHVVDPANRVNGKLNILIEDGKIAWVGTSMKEADRMIDELERNLEARIEELRNEEI